MVDPGRDARASKGRVLSSSTDEDCPIMFLKTPYARSAKEEPCDWLLPVLKPEYLRGGEET